MITPVGDGRTGLFSRVLLLIAVAVGAGPGTRPGTAPPAWSLSEPRPGKMTAPIDITIESDEAAMGPGVSSTLSATFAARQDIPALWLRIDVEGPVVLEGAADASLGPLFEGRPITVAIPIRVTDVGEAAVHVRAEAVDGNGAPLFWRSATVYALVRADRTLAATTNFQDLRLRAIRDDEDSGRLGAGDADAARRALAETPARRDSAPMTYRAFTPQEQELNAIVGAPRRGHLPVERGSAPIIEGAGTITVQGNVQWTDENGGTHPVYGASVNILDDDGLLGTEFVTAVPTDAAGNYSAVVNNDDGFLQGDRDVFVRALAGNTLVVTKSNSNDIYGMTSSVHSETPSGTVITENFTAANNGGGEAWSVFQAGTWVAVYAQQAHGSPLASVDIVWPFGGGTFYNGRINILQLDRWDWDVIMREYGHHIQAQLNTANSPGGDHGSGCASDARKSKDKGVRLAWGEGWPTYDGTVAQQILDLASLGVPRVGDVSYQDLEDQTLVYSLEANGGGDQGEDDETAVQRLLWDLYDSANDGRDAISRTDASIWNAIDAADPPTLSAAWTALRSGQSNETDLLMGGIASDQLIGPRLISPSQGTIVTPSNASFSWNSDVGCSTSYDGNRFDLVFYNASSFAKVLAIPGLAGTSATLTPAQLATLIGAGHNILWAVEGYNTDSPATGPYLGENLAIVVNRPPVANAGPDQPSVECASRTTTPVQLKGTASSDPDGDPLTYEWSAPGVTFNDIHSATPTGQFPMGTTVVTLAVSDAIQVASDTVSITVLDTTPPVITCPANITVECTGNCGIQAVDPQLAAFFAGVSATDICDATPAITHDAPAFLPLGNTTVTLTARDDSGNFSTCTAGGRHEFRPPGSTTSWSVPRGSAPRRGAVRDIG